MLEKLTVSLSVQIDVHKHSTSLLFYLRSLLIYFPRLQFIGLYLSYDKVIDTHIHTTCPIDHTDMPCMSLSSVMSPFIFYRNKNYSVLFAIKIDYWWQKIYARQNTESLRLNKKNNLSMSPRKLHFISSYISILAIH